MNRENIEVGRYTLPTDIIEAARKVETFFYEMGCSKWELMGICSRNLVAQQIGVWIRNAIENGGSLRVAKKSTEYWATMFWPDDRPIDGRGKTIEGALQDLNESLQEDAAQEMLNNPNSGV